MFEVIGYVFLFLACFSILFCHIAHFALWQSKINLLPDENPEKKKVATTGSTIKNFYKEIPYRWIGVSLQFVFRIICLGAEFIFRASAFACKTAVVKTAKAWKKLTAPRPKKNRKQRQPKLQPDPIQTMLHLAEARVPEVQVLTNSDVGKLEISIDASGKPVVDISGEAEEMKLPHEEIPGETIITPESLKAVDMTAFNKIDKSMASARDYGEKEHFKKIYDTCLDFDRCLETESGEKVLQIIFPTDNSFREEAWAGLSLYLPKAERKSPWAKPPTEEKGMVVFEDFGTTGLGKPPRRVFENSAETGDPLLPTNILVDDLLRDLETERSLTTIAKENHMSITDVIKNVLSMTFGKLGKPENDPELMQLHRKILFSEVEKKIAENHKTAARIWGEAVALEEEVLDARNALLPKRLSVMQNDIGLLLERQRLGTEALNGRLDPGKLLVAYPADSQGLPAIPPESLAEETATAETLGNRQKPAASAILQEEVDELLSAQERK